MTLMTTTSTATPSPRPSTDTQVINETKARPRIARYRQPIQSDVAPAMGRAHGDAASIRRPSVRYSRRCIRCGEFFIVRHDDECGTASVREVEHHRKHLIGAFLIEVAGGFVRKHYGGIGDQCARDRDTLPLAAGQLVRTMIEASTQAHRFENLDGALLRIGGAGARQAAAASRRFPLR